MKGHVGGGPGHRGVQGLGGSVKLKPFHMSRYISTVYVMCRNGSLKSALDVLVFFHEAPVVEHQLESLILAQNERWRHA